MNKFNLNTFQLNKWLFFTFNNININSDDIKNSVIIPSIDSFKKEVIEPLLGIGTINENMKVNIIAKAYNGNTFKSIIPLQTLETKDILLLRDVMLGHYNTFHADNYIIEDFKELVFNFRILSYDFIPNIKPKLLNVEDHINFKYKVFFDKISNVNLPLTMDLFQWGNIKFNSNFTCADLNIDGLEYHFILHNNYYECYINTINDNNLIIFRDTLLDRSGQDLTHFKREILRKWSVVKLFIYNDYQLIFKAKKHYPSFLKKVKKVDHLSNKLMTIDIETKVTNGKMEAICISIFDGKIKKSFFIDDFLTSEEMIIRAIKYLNKPKYNGFKVYAHNFSSFDAIFILSRLVKNAKLEIKNRDGVLIEIKCRFSRNVSITFRDSYLLLPSSLDSLAKNFIKENKNLFPYDFVNKTNLDYNGDVPNISYFNDISQDEYLSYKSSFNNNKWNLKKETIKYCESDVILLYRVIRKFATRIFNLYHVDVLKYPTLPSLAFAIYRSNFLNEIWNISNLDGEIYKFISRSYSGGHVDLYYHQNNDNEKVYRYDVNSLYPYSMMNCSMPTGYPIQFEGNILDNEIYDIVANTFNLNERYGFFESNIETHKDLFIPIILKKIKIDKVGYRTIAPLGKWTDVYHSEELNNALKYGYKYTTNKGYLFNKGYIFKDYVNSLYELKKSSNSGEPNYIISKLLLNSLYGRFGMNPYYLKSELLSNTELDNYIYLNDNIHIYDKLELSDNLNLISYYKEDCNDKYDKSNNVNVAIASSITAFSRIHMSYFKQMDGYKVFYSDTDSIDLNKPLPDEFVGKELGLLKLEHVWEKAIYISNKAYIGIDKEGKIYRKLRGIKVNSKEFKNNPIEIEDFEKLLYKDSELLVNQERWFKSFRNSNIETKEIIYKLQGNDNKRISIIENGKKSYTKPLII